MPQSESIAKLAEALSAAQGEFAVVKKQAENPFFKSKYADLSSVLEAVQPALTKHKLAIIQSPSTDTEKRTVSVETTLIHASGEWKSSTFEMPVAEWKAQGLGSTLTYLRRYAVGAILNIAPEEDDDGNQASGRTNGDAVQQSKPTQPAQSSAPRAAAKKSAPKAEAPKPEVKKEEPKATESKEDTRTPQEKLRDEVRVIMGNASLNIKGASIKEFIVRTSGNEKHAANDKFRLEDLSDTEATLVYNKIAEAAKADKLADLFKGESK